MNIRPVIAAAGQAISRWQPGEPHPPSPTSLRLQAAKAALAGLRLPRLDALAVVRTTEDSVPTSTHPNGRDANPPGTLARALGREFGLEVGERVYGGVGGHTPQSLVGEMAARIARGEVGSALVVGAEATAAAKAARRADVELDWADGDPALTTDRGADLSAALAWISTAELRHGLHTPAHYYALMERRLTHTLSHGRKAHRRWMGELFAPLSDVAARNPWAQFPEARSAEWLAAPSATNYSVTDPYLRWHVAQDAVNQGAAVLLMSEASAREAGAGRLTFVRGGAEAHAPHLSQRADVGLSRAMQRAVESLRASTGLRGVPDALDLYSCFPVALWNAWQAVEPGANPPLDRALTLTGGLPFFGGPGNNYSLHAIAEMHTRLAGTRDTGLVLANGGWMSKAAVGLYSGEPAPFHAPPPTERLPAEVEVADGDGEVEGRLETFTFTSNREGAPQTGTAFVRLADGRRALAVVAGGALATLAEREPIGAPARVRTAGGVGQLASLG